MSNFDQDQETVYPSRPLAGDSNPSLEGDHLKSGMPDFVGSYAVLGRLGEGGMGSVYLARQEIPEREVALKLIAKDRVSKDFIHLFESEYEVLAIMNHPHIAQVYEVGLTPEGNPYFTMEYIKDGKPLTSFCRNAALGLEERLRLFEQVCQGVQHAHQRAVVHRDLKPANILVTTLGDKPTIKIIDFGIAKRLHLSGERGRMTQVGDLVGTPAFISPEQLAGGRGGIDTRSDIYALGVVLYELVADLEPFDEARFDALPMDEKLRIYREEDPPRPSERLLKAGGREAEVIANRQLARRVRGDLDAVVMKAMAKDPNKRYSDVGELIRDLANYLEQRPVSARLPGLVDRTAKFLRRNKVGAIAGFLVLLALGVGLGLAARSHQRTLIALRETELAREEAELINAFLQETVRAPDPGLYGRDVKVIQILERTEKRLEKMTDKEWELEASFRNSLGATYLGLGFYEEAERHIRRAVEITRDRLPANSPKLGNYQYNLARALRRLEKYEDAERAGRSAVAILEESRGPKHAETNVARVNLGMILRSLDLLDDAEQELNHALKHLIEVYGESHEETLLARSALANVVAERGDAEAAEALYDQVITKGTLVLGKDHPTVMAAMKNYANSLRRRKELGRAESIFRDVLELRRESLGDEHSYVERARYSLGLCVFDMGRYDEAEMHLGQVLNQRLALSESTDPRVLRVVNVLAKTMMIQDEKEEAIALLQDFSRALAVEDEAGKSKNNLKRLQEISTRRNLGTFLIEAKQYHEGLNELRALVQEGLASSSASVSNFLVLLGQARALQGMGRNEEAEAFFCLALESADTISKKSNNSDPLAEAQAYYALFQVEQGRTDEARTLLQRALELLNADTDLELRSKIEGMQVSIEENGARKTSAQTP